MLKPSLYLLERYCCIRYFALPGEDICNSEFRYNIRITNNIMTTPTTQDSMMVTLLREASDLFLLRLLLFDLLTPDIPP